MTAQPAARTILPEFITISSILLEEVDHFPYLGSFNIQLIQEGCRERICAMLENDPTNQNPKTVVPKIFSLGRILGIKICLCLSKFYVISTFKNEKQ